MRDVLIPQVHTCAGASHLPGRKHQGRWGGVGRRGMSRLWRVGRERHQRGDLKAGWELPSVEGHGGASPGEVHAQAGAFHSAQGRPVGGTVWVRGLHSMSSRGAEG